MRRIFAIIALLFLMAGNAWAVDQTIKATEEMVGSGHATKTDTLNRLALVEHNTDGTHKAGGGAPTGSITAFAAATAPSGWLECNGAAVDRTTYAALFTVIGDDYGVGDGATTFNLPDFRGKFMRGWDHGAGVDPNAAARTDRGDGTGGDVVGSKQGDAFQGHKHDTNFITFASGSAGSAVGTNLNTAGVGNPSTDGVNGTPRTSSESRPLNTNVMYIIKY